MTGPLWGGRLKGIWGTIELLSIGLVAGIGSQMVMSPEPAKMGPNVAKLHFFAQLLLIVGALGILATQVLRYRVSKDPSLRSRYMR